VSIGVVAIFIDRVDESIHQIATGRRVRYRLESDISSLRAEALPRPDFLHELQRTKLRTLTGKEVAMRHHCFVKLLLASNQLACLLSAYHFLFVSLKLTIKKTAQMVEEKAGSVPVTAEVDPDEKEERTERTRFPPGFPLKTQRQKQFARVQALSKAIKANEHLEENKEEEN
jgi:hypothetical protein